MGLNSDNFDDDLCADLLEAISFSLFILSNSLLDVKITEANVSHNNIMAKDRLVKIHCLVI
jgi:hypothetical protein